MDSASTSHPAQNLKRLLRLDRLSPGIRKLLVSFVGGAVLLAGIAMIFLPGPAVVVIPLGLAILGSEFPWAQRWLSKGGKWLKATVKRFRRG